MIQKQQVLSPIDLFILLKIIAKGKTSWFQASLATDLGVSQSEVSKSLARSKYAGLVDPTGKLVMRLALMELLQYGVHYFFATKTWCYC